MTREAMDAQLGRLVVLKGMPGDSDPYWEALQDIPLDVFTLAMGHALKTRTWFPTPAEIRHDCDAAKPRRAMGVHPTSYMVPMDGAATVYIPNPLGGAGITVQVTHDRQPYCAECDDSGTVSFWCGAGPGRRWPWLPVQRCGGHEGHGEHDWAGKCACEAYSPVIQRRKEAARERFAQPPQKAA